MSAPDIEFTIRLNFYTETQFQRYLNWYGQNAKQAKNNLIVGLAVIEAILAAERLRRDRRIGLGEFVRELGVSQ